MDGHDPAQDHWWHNDDYSGEAAAIAAADAEDNFLGMFGNSTEDLFNLVWEGGTTGTGHQAVPSIPSSPPPELPSCPSGVSLNPPPSNDMMAAWLWLYPIVSGELDHAGDSRKVIPADQVKSEPSTTESKGKLHATEDMSGATKENTGSGSSERRKAASGGSSRTRSSHHSGTHNSTEKRRRCKISDRLRTLQQLVPGCDKSNQASTLEQTIQYMKSLQQQVESMNMSPSAQAAAAMYPGMQPPPTAAVAVPIPMVPYGPYAHYHAVMMPAAASSAVPVMMLTPATSADPERQSDICMEQRRHRKEKGKRRL